jgi:polyferredoxin
MNVSGLDDMKKKRKLVQLLCAVLYNCHITGFADGTIYQGNLKSACVPGLNCYSCPGASFSCPLGSLQSALVSSKYRFPYYILGVLLLFGIFLGRIICGFLCPFGLIQELLYKIPSKKLKKNIWTRRLSCLKYVILVIFVIVIPLVLQMPGFCKFICPAGTLEGGIPLLLKNESLRQMAGWLFRWKTLLLLLILLSTVFLFRSFCRFLCPLGAFYGLFHRFSLFGMRVDKEKCTDCGACIRHCKLDVKKVGDTECIQCGECIESCPTCALSFKSIKK